MENKKTILRFQIFSIIFVCVLGTLLHFVYEWSNNNVLIGSFSAVNESTWEHLKLVFFPMLITTIIGYFYIGKDVPNFLCAKTKGVVTSILFIVIFFYTYSGILGTNIAIIDIASFFISVILGEFLAYRKMISNSKCNEKIVTIFLIILLLCFIAFTYFPPKIGLFEDPITSSYGVLDEK